VWAGHWANTRWTGPVIRGTRPCNAVVESNHVAVGLWQSLGFEVVGTVPEAFEHPTLGRVGLHVMHRRL
jgi:hypothetical protein